MAKQQKIMEDLSFHRDFGPKSPNMSNQIKILSDFFHISSTSGMKDRKFDHVLQFNELIT